MSKISRRTFLKDSAKIGTALGFPTIISANVLGRGPKLSPSERVNVGLISCGGRSIICNEYQDYAKAQVVAVCDPRSDLRQAKKQQFQGCAAYSDFRELLARKDVDAVHISTPDHWHVPISLAAARAGKDMYTEKPLGICIEQTLAAREIVTKHHRIFQYGTQNRSMAQVRLGIELVLNGHIGEVREVYVWCPPGESGGKPQPELPVPEGFDYDLWLGPAPETPFCRDRCYGEGQRKGIYHIYDYAIGFIAGWGAHPMDQLQWWADNAGLTIPVSYQGKGRIPEAGLFDTVTHWDMTCTYTGGLKMRFLDDETAREQHKIPHIGQLKFTHGTLFVGSQGWVAVTRGGWQVYPESLYQKAKQPGSVRLIESRSHTKHFVDRVLDRQQPISDLESAVRSDLICHLCDLTIRTGQDVQWDSQKQTILGNERALAMLSRPLRSPWHV